MVLNLVIMINFSSMSYRFLSVVAFSFNVVQMKEFVKIDAFEIFINTFSNLI